MLRETRNESLSSKLMTFTLLAVTVAVVAIGLAALTSVYGLARDQAASEYRAVGDVFILEVDRRFESSTRTLDSVSAILIDPTRDEIDHKAVVDSFELGFENVEELVIADSDGTILVSLPENAGRTEISSIPVRRTSISDVTLFHFNSDGSDSELWISRAMSGPHGELVVLVRVRTAFMETLRDEFSSAVSQRTVAIVDSSGELLFVGEGGQSLSSSSIEYMLAEHDNHGDVTAVDAAGEPLWGQWALIEGNPGLDWRVIVVEPEATVSATTWNTLLPTILALVFSAALSVALVGLFGSRLVAPLRALETHALEAVSGAYVSPVNIDRRDEVGRLAEAFNAIALRLNALQDLSQLLASSSSLDDVLDGILSAMGHIVGSANVAVLLVDDSRSRLYSARSQGILSAEGSQIPLHRQPWLAHAMESSEPVTFTGGGEELGLTLSGASGTGSISGLVASMRVAAEPLGLIVILKEDSREFSQAEIEMIRTFSAQAAIAVHNSRLFEIESASRQEAEAMRTVAEALADPTDVARSFDTVARITQNLFGVTSARIAFMDRAALGLPVADDDAGEHILLRAWESVWAEGDGDLVVRVSAGDESVIDRYLDSVGGVEALFLTVMRLDQPGAVVALVIDRPDRTFTSHERSLAYATGKQLALALDNAFHYAEARARASNLETIFRISQAVSSSLQIKVVLNRVLDVVQKIFTADTVSLMQYDDATHLIETVMARGLISADMLHYSCAPGEDVPGRVFETGEPKKIDDLYAEETALPTIAIGQGLQSMLSVPLLARGRSIGVLTIYSVAPDSFSDEDMGLLHTFASQAALAIDTAALYGHEHHVASVLQNSILPKNLPDYHEIESSSVYLPAGGDVEIGGDYFDVFRNPKGRIVLAIGDVCGKGVEAATKTSMIKYTVRGLVAAGLNPAEVLSEVNKAVASSGDLSEIVTLWVGVLDPERGVLRYADGGHPPGFVRHTQDAVTEHLPVTGALLGALPEAEYEEREVSFKPNDILLVYTDGVTEARRGNKFFGEGRVRRAINAGGSTDDVVDRLLSALDRFAPGALRDDAAILAIRLRTNEERADGTAMDETT